MKQKKIPMRMCIGCREMKEKRNLIRIVRSPEGELSIDGTGKKPGRGAYICKTADCFQKAIKQHQVERTFSCQLTDDMKIKLNEQLAVLNE